MKLREMHLFAGIGGGILAGMLLGHRPVCAVEIDPYCREVLRARQSEGVLPQFPVLEDVRKLDARDWRGRVDIVCGGFPCQPWSPAGKRRGADDPRHLWPEMARIVSECRPALVFAENVALAAFREPWRDLRGMGYCVPPALCLSAGDLGAPFQRRRWWLLAADLDQVRQLVQPVDGQVAGACAAGDVDLAGLAEWQGERGDSRPQFKAAVGATWQVATPRLRRLVSGPAVGVDSRRKRIGAAGNAQVPAVAAAAFCELFQRLSGGGA